MKPPQEPTDKRRMKAAADTRSNHAMDNPPIDRWLVLPDAGTRADHDPSAGASYGVALTADGRIAVYVRALDAGRDMVVSAYRALDDIPTDELPDNVRELAARQLGERFVVLLDG